MLVNFVWKYILDFMGLPLKLGVGEAGKYDPDKILLQA